MNQENAADRQAAQQAREQEKKYADSATAVSPDTQYDDPQAGIEKSPFSGDADGAGSSGQSSVFDDPAKPRESSNVDEGPDGSEDPT